ncbi:MAG TPA: ABC transporter permease [bacterium]|nr:ABC transporter permease [bacterium]
MSISALSLVLSRDLKRRPARNLLLGLCVAAVTGMQVAAALLDAASRRGLELGLARMGADLVAVPRGLSDELTHSYMTGEAALFYMDAAVEQKIAALPFVDRTSPQVYIKSLSGASCCSAWNIFLIGFDPATDFTVRPWLTAHRETPLGPDDVLVGAAIASEPGTNIKFYGRQFRIAGTLDATGTGLDTTVFIPIRAAYLMAKESPVKAVKPLDLPESKVSAVMIKLKPKSAGGSPAYRAAYELEMRFPEISVIQPEDFMVRVQKNLAATLGTLRSASYAVWPVTALLIGLVFGMAANERRREIGLLRAMGATRGFVFRMIIGGALIVCGAGAAAGMAAAAGLTSAFSRLIALKLEVPFYWPGMGDLAAILGAACALALLTGGLAALVPAISASRMEPYEAIRRGE